MRHSYLSHSEPNLARFLVFFSLEIDLCGVLRGKKRHKNIVQYSSEAVNSSTKNQDEYKACRLFSMSSERLEHQQDQDKSTKKCCKSFILIVGMGVGSDLRKKNFQHGLIDSGSLPQALKP